VLEIELANRKMPRVPCGQRNAERHGRGGDETVRLRESYSRGGVISAPPPRKLAMGSIDLDDSQPIEKLIHRSGFAVPQPAMNLLDIDRRGTRDARLSTQGAQPLDGSGSTAEYVDQDRGVEKNGH
jgi:hypothetical protein